ncbi:hypothetical protein ABMB44_13850 [Levilactobacillus brevis]
MSDQEKWRALDKVRGVQLGTTEQEFRQKELEKREQQIREDETPKITRRITERRIAMTELERIEALEKQLKTRKRKALAKEYERLPSS